MTQKFIVISGSVRFLNEFIEEYIKISLEGNIPFSVASNAKERIDYNQIKPSLDRMYQDVITKYADELRVLNIDGYIGESTKNEINCAKKKGIPIIYKEKIK